MAEKLKTVLIIEDSITEALSLRLLLENAGLVVLHAPNGGRGVSMVQQHLPDVVLLDIEMPGMNGFEVAVQLSHDPRTEHIPIIMLTSHDDARSLLKGMRLGAIDFIPKDAFSDAILMETLRQLKIVGPATGPDLRG